VLVGLATVANGVVYLTGGFGAVVHAINASAGMELRTPKSELQGFVFAAPAIVNGQLYVGAYDHHLHAYVL
jgi:outer membrane protein assembly factor BamB